MEKSDDLNYSVSPMVMNQKEAADWIIQEVEAILSNLSTKDQVGSERVTQGAAQALLAKIYLNYEVYGGESRWVEAITYSDQRII